MAECKVFYSWQSDLPNSTNRGFIQKALENAVKSIHSDDSIEVKPVVDRDTAGVPGSPDIASTIFAKIEQADVFVCDVSIINPGSNSRLTPNPNVLIELGYAIKTLGSERVIMVMNMASGIREHLPFDLRTRRVISYNILESSTEKAEERRKLEKDLYKALNFVFTNQNSYTTEIEEVVQPLSIVEEAKAAIENSQPNQGILIRRHMSYLVEQLDSIAPDFRASVSDQMIVNAIAQTIELGIEFACLSETIALMKSSSAAMALYKEFEKIINRYHTPANYIGTFYEAAFDFYKFVGHEFFTIFLSFLIRERQWNTIGDLLDEEFYILKSYGSESPTTVSFTCVCSYPKSLYLLRQYPNLLNERHTQGAFAEIVSMQQFIDADCFLLLRSAFQETDSIHSLLGWKAWSLFYLKQTPRYLIEAYRVNNAQKLLAPLKVDSVEVFKKLMIEITPQLGEAVGNRFSLSLQRHPLGDFDPQQIGSR